MYNFYSFGKLLQLFTNMNVLKLVNLKLFVKAIF